MEDKTCRHMPDLGLFYMMHVRPVFAGEGGTLTGTALVFNSVTQPGLLALPRHSLLNQGEDKREPSYFFVLSNVRCPPDRRNHMGSVLRLSDVGKIASPPKPPAY